MARKMIEEALEHPDTYRLKCDICGKLYEAENEDFRYVGNETLSCECPWCKKENWVRIRALQKSKIHYGASYKYVG